DRRIAHVARRRPVARRPSRDADARPRATLARLDAQLLLALRRGAGVRARRGGGAGAARVQLLRLHRVRQPAAGGHDDPRHAARRGRAAAARHRARLRDVGAARRVPRGRRDGQRGRGARDARGDGPARGARRDHRALFAPGGRDRGRGVRGARRRRRASAESGGDRDPRVPAGSDPLGGRRVHDQQVGAAGLDPPPPPGGPSARRARL
ncbi:MAG: hypothetical protein AVDCRST_MAG85-709, partial [uncultured Solirubrobacteraceae bacterium]